MKDGVVRSYHGQSAEILAGRELDGTLQLINCTAAASQGRDWNVSCCSDTMAKSLSSDELGSLKPKNILNAHLHPKVTHLQGATTPPHWVHTL